MTAQTTSKTGLDLKRYEDTVIAALRDADARLATFETKAKAEREQATIPAIEHVKVARTTLEQQLKALGTASAAHVQRAKKDIDAASVALKAALDEVATRFASASAKATSTSRTDAVSEQK